MRYYVFIIAVLFLSGALAKQLLNNNYRHQNKGSWEAPKSADELKDPFKDKKSSGTEGKTLFLQYCVPCHGTEGYGNGVASATLNPKPANLSSKDIQGQSDGSLFWKISNGRGNMVAWQFTLSEKQRWHLVDYVRILGKQSK